jgi:pimeloyl-ACP methyl ester carboxylesterase
MTRSPRRGSVAFVGAGPGQADLITLRGAERLRTADVVLFDALADPALRAFAPAARWIDVGKRGFVGVPHPPRGGRENTGQDTINALLGDLQQVRVPTLVLCGEQDPVTPVADHAAIAAGIAGARFERIADCGHLSTIEQPDAVTRVVVEWLAQTAPGSGGLATPSP